MPDERQTQHVDVHQLPQAAGGPDHDVNARLDPFSLRLDGRLAPNRRDLDQ